MTAFTPTWTRRALMGLALSVCAGATLAQTPTAAQPASSFPNRPI